MSIKDELQIFIKLMINTKKWAKDSKIPSENQMANRFFCSRLTVRKAYQQLITEGYLISKKRQGYWVSQNPPIFNTNESTTITTTTTFNKKFDSVPQDEKELFFQLSSPVMGNELDFKYFYKKYFESNENLASNKFYKVIEAFTNAEVVEKISQEMIDESIAFSYWINKVVVSHRKRVMVTRKLNEDERAKFGLKTDEFFTIVYGVLFDANNNIIEFSKDYTRHDKVKIYCDQELF